MAKPDCDLQTAIENIDIGGPTMLRAAAKNNRFVAVVVNPEDYAPVLKQLKNNTCCLNQIIRFDLAVKAYEHTAAYDGAIASYLGARGADGTSHESPYPRTFNCQFIKKQDMRYGENPHQSAAFYVERGTAETSVSTAIQLQGKALSYNNIADTDAAMECVKSFSEPACVIVKHANPCGVGLGGDLRQAYEKAFATDPTSAFGGIIAFNRPLDADLLGLILERQFVEVVIAPAVSSEAVAVAQQKKNVRLLSCGERAGAGRGMEFKRVGAGWMLQDADETCLDDSALRVVTKVQPTEAQLADLHFAWKVAWYTKSNAIVYARDAQTIGVGAGQMSRVISAKIAGLKAAEEGMSVPGAVMASDAFFPRATSEGFSLCAPFGVWG